jgi:hypothetical protein
MRIIVALVSRQLPLISTVQLKFTIPPSVGSPRFARGTEGSWFPLLAGGTLRRGFQFRLFL